MKDDYTEYLVNQKNFRIMALVAVVTLIGGATFYHHVEKLNWLDAFYFSTITLTTVGYGDIVPTTPLGKFFTIFYVLLGIGIIATFANLFLKNAVSKRQYKRDKRQESKADSTD